MGFLPRRLILPAAILLAGAVAALFFFRFQSVLTIRQGRTGALLAAVPLSRGDGFELRYVHSVNRGAVRDRFFVDRRGAIVLADSVFQSFGAGMEEGLGGPDPVALEAEGLVLRNLNRDLGVIRVAVGSAADHRLYFADGRELPLKAVAQPLTFVTIAFEFIVLRGFHGKSRD